MLFCVYFVSFLKKGSGSSQQEPTSSFRGWCETKRRSARCRCRVQHYLLFNPHVRAWQMAVVWWGSWCRKVESWGSFQVFYSAASFTWINLKKVSTALKVRIGGMVGSVTTPLQSHLCLSEHLSTARVRTIPLLRQGSSNYYSYPMMEKWLSATNICIL